jgi:hypothetical protein
MNGITFDAGGLIALDPFRLPRWHRPFVTQPDRRESPGLSGRPTRTWFRSMGPMQVLLDFCWREPRRRISSMLTS